MLRSKDTQTRLGTVGITRDSVSRDASSICKIIKHSTRLRFLMATLSSLFQIIHSFRYALTVCRRKGTKREASYVCLIRLDCFYFDAENLQLLHWPHVSRVIRFIIWILFNINLRLFYLCIFGAKRRCNSNVLVHI